MHAASCCFAAGTAAAAGPAAVPLLCPAAEDTRMGNPARLQHTGVKGVSFPLARRSQGHLDFRNLALTSGLCFWKRLGGRWGGVGKAAEMG